MTVDWFADVAAPVGRDTVPVIFVIFQVPLCAAETESDPEDRFQFREVTHGEVDCVTPNVDGKFPTLTESVVFRSVHVLPVVHVPFCDTACTLGKLSTSTCRFDPVDCPTVKVPVPAFAVTVPLIGCVAGKFETDTEPLIGWVTPEPSTFHADAPAVPWFAVTVPDTGWVPGKLDTLTVPLIG
jgi:hypothetical protein